MLLIRLFAKNSTLWLFVMGSLLVGAYVYATVDKTAYTTEQLVVIPDMVDSSSWAGPDKILQNDITEESLYQDFSPENSAYIDFDLINKPIIVPPVLNVDDTDIKLPADDVVLDIGDENTPIDNPIDNPESNPVEPPANTEEIIEVVEMPAEESSEPEEPLPEPETPQTEPVVSSIETASEESLSLSSGTLLWGLLPLAVGRFPLAQEVITTYVTTTEGVVPTVTESDDVADNAAAVPVGDSTESEIDSVSTTEPVQDLEEEIGTVESGDTVPTNEPIADNVDDETDEESLILEEDNSLEVIESITTITDACVGDADCKIYSTTFSGFAMPEFASGSFLTSAQLRLSLAARTISQDDTGPQRFVVEYSYSADGEWQTATTIDIDDEASNSINGGYYLVSLDRPAHQSQLSFLQVRVSYQGNIKYLKRAYIESLWLEVTSASFYEETDPEFNETAIDYDRDLMTAKFHEVNESDLDPVINELPTFTMSYSPQQGFFKRMATAVFSENKYAVEQIRLINGVGTVVDVPVDIIYHDDKTWTIKFLKQPQKLVPGKYQLEVTINENEKLFIDAFEFYWGVLAVNTTKSMYFTNEKVVLNLAALTDKGDTICDASLALKIIDPSNTIFEIPVEQSGSCGKNNVTDVPDYLAYFNEASELGRYTVQLQHLNREGKMVHKIEDHFEVREYIPFAIERTAPTRIYPPATYDVKLKITAYRSFSGDITERVPRGFVLENTGSAEIVTAPEYTELVWRNITLKEGDKLELSYQFDAPDISPYMYLLGPLNMDGFTELRQWQIASDALTAIAALSGTRTVAGTNLNGTPSPMQWSTSSVDAYYYDHSTSTDSQKLIFRQGGDYFLAVNIPQQRTDANARGTRIGAEVRVNGVSVPEGLGRSGYITNQNAHSESSTHAFFLLSDVVADDYVEVFIEGLTTINAADIVNVTGAASMYLEYIDVSENVFAATTTQTINSVNLNQTTEYAFSLIETRQDAGFTHSDAINPEQIIIANPGTYLVEASIPLSTDTTNTNILGRVRLDGAQVLGGQFKQGYAQSPATESDGVSSLHFSGIVIATTTNQVLTLTATREGQTGNVTITSGFTGSVFVRELPSTEVIALRGTAVVGGTNWNPAAAAAVQWSGRDQTDAAVFTHSTTTNNHQITIAADGDYFVSYNDALTGSLTRGNSRVAILKNGAAITGAQTKSHYIRNQNNHTESSAALVMLIEGLVNGDVITVTTVAEAAAGTLDDSTAAVFTMWKKITLDERPDAPVTYNAPFDNIRFASTTPYFDFSATDPDGVSNIEYEFSIATSTGFTASTTYNSATDSEFFNTASSSDASPFTESNKIRFQLTSGDALTDLTTYYWRARARDVTGSGEFGDWSTTQSLTVDLAVAAPSWFQSYSGQFEGDTLIGTVSSGGDQVQVDATVSSEVLIAYGEGTLTTPKYRFWNGATWGVEGSAIAVTNTINWVRTAASVSRDEYALVTLDASNDAYTQIYSASTSSWGNQTLLSSVVSSAAYRGIATAYESVSGDLMAISCSNGPNPVYRTWNGSTWSATSSITVSSVNNCNFLELAADPTSDEMVLVVRDTGTQYEALVWNGSAWVESRVIGSSALVAREGLSVAYESSGDQAVVAVSNNANNNIIYTTWNGVEFSTNATQAIGNDLEFGKLVSDPNSDKLALCYIDTDNDIGVLRWDGGVWATFVELDTAGNIDTGRPVDCTFETFAGRPDYLLSTYSDTTNARYRAATGTTWSTEASITTIEDSFWVQTERAGDGTILMVALDDTVDDLDVSFWNGTAWSAKETLETSPSSVIADPYEMYDLSAKRFQFSEGQVVTPPIDFTAVPNQPTWGDISFSTTEPFGTDVTVRVKYSNVTTCDSYIPNGALSGNDAGFDVSASPIDLTALSTTTYDQICLEATLTTLGSASALLDDWTLAWVRQPKLVQNNYRWYVNGSFLTPTDPWPVGVDDVAENTALTSNFAVNTSETIRLRMSLQGANISQPAFTEAFKLQYAEGLNCNQSLNWSDVGNAASTTALWRGFENSIVGDDWYDADWSRRIKLTVDNVLVPASLTGFPVYVNLADLPDNFFTAVQSDGDDIRITNADGVTELPFELVKINTASKIGELHFKADLSSTTDSEFYIYYRNAAASGYANTATYGRNNVWSNSYEAVYHLETSPVSALVDSTSNGRNLTAAGGSGMGAGNSTSSVMGNGMDFDGVNDRLTNSGFAWTAIPVTVTAWNNVATAEVQNSNLFGFTISGSERLASHAPWSDNTLYWDYGTCCAAPGRISTNYTTYRNKWTHVGLVSQGATGAAMAIYLDGSVVASAASSDDPNVTLTGFSLGSDNPTGGNHHSGRVDEFRIASVARTASWMSAERNNQSNPTGFYAVSAEELISDGRTLPTTILTASDYPETYEEENPTRENQNELPVGDDAEWDFVLQNNAAQVNTNYCFRMVYEDGSLFNTYTNYPRLITNAPPLAPELYMPFANERLASTTPWFEFAATDEVGDDIAYQIQIDTDVNFASPDIDTDSVTSFALFTNLLQPSQKSEFTSGQRIRFEAVTSLTNGDTYWWRVRGQDLAGSGAEGEWSTPYSVTINTSNTISTWFQTTGSQFATNNLQDLVVSTSTNDIGIESGFTNGTSTSGTIDYDDRTTGNAWGDLSFTQNVTSGSITYRVEYLVAGDNFSLIPNSDLPGNSAGFTSSPVSLTDLNTTIYNEIRIVAVLNGNTTLPRLQDWTVTWAETIEIPVLNDPFDNAKVSTTTPALVFSTVDPEADAVQYEVQLSSSYDFSASSTFTSGVEAGFRNTEDVVDTSPFTSGAVIEYKVQSALTNGDTYWWRVRARDPLGDNSWSDYSVPESFTVDIAITVSAWHQTTGEQFLTGAVDSIETTAGSAQITTTISEVLMAYGEGTGQAPRYRLWNGSVWSAAGTAASVGAQIRWIDLEAASTRPEYALGTIGTDADVNVQIYDAEADSWADVNELVTNIPDTLQRGFDIAYETTSGDLLSVSCSGTDAVYAIWNGTTWSATSSLALANANNCLYVELAVDPISDEIIAVFKHTNTAATDYEIMVWSGSAWGNALALADMAENANAGAAVVYEESGNQAIVALTNNAATTLLYALWNGSSWATSTQALGDHIEWATLRNDVGSDKVALCYVDNDTNIGVLQWSGSAWNTFTELEQFANGKAGYGIDCAFETLGSRDGYLMAPYSDNTAGRYQFYATSSFSGELNISTIQDSWRVLSVRGGDGIIHSVFFDDTNDRYDTSRWDGSAWSTLETLSTTPSIIGTPFDGSLAMAARTYPDFTSGSVRSTAIDFNDGSGPRWEEFNFTDTTAGSSYIEYRLYYLASSSAYILIPDSALPGNSAGFLTSPIDISALDRTIYETLQLDAQFICVAGDCPVLNDWTVEWSEGITVSGTAFEYNASTTLTSGTVAVAVNGTLQSGKTGTILGDGTWVIDNVTAFADDVITVFIEGVIDTNEAMAVTIYDGVGDVTNMQLAERHLTLGSSDNQILTNADLGQYVYADDEDLFFSVDGSNVLTLCVDSGCGVSKLRILAGTTYEPGANSLVVDFENVGTFSPATNTIRVAGVWSQNGVFNTDASTVIFTGTSSTFTLQTASSSFSFFNVTFGETSGSAIWSLAKALLVNGTLAINNGTLNRSTSTISIAQNLQFGANGLISGLATTTFNGSGSHTWSDAKAVASSSNAGYVVVEGTAKTITLAGNVGAETVTIGADDTLNASGSGFNINVNSGWVNNNVFIPQTGTVTFVGTSTTAINRGSSSFNNLSFTGVGGNWSFTTPTLALGGNLSIATGTVTMPTGTTTIAGSFLNTGGTFLHNNGEVRMTSTAGGRTITQSGTTFLNAFYDLVFSGSGSWSFTEASATTSRNFRIQSGVVTLASSTLTVGSDFLTTGTGAFNHNNGEVILLVQSSDDVSTNGSSFNNLRIKGDTVSSWYNSSWAKRVRIAVDDTKVPTSVTDFPVYVNLADLPTTFFSGVQADGDDIRITNSDGITELPYELVAINTTLKTGELHFKANLSSTTDSEFYVYYGNSGASGYAAAATYGRNNVWTNSFEGVYHLGTDPTSAVIDSTSNGRNLTAQGGMGVGNSVAGVIGNGIDFDGANDYLRNTTFAWTANPVTVTAWNNVATAELATANMFGFTASGNERNSVHGPYSDSILYWDYGTCCTAPGRLTTSYTSSLNKWTHIGLVSQGGAGSFMGIYLDGALAASAATSDDPNVTLTGFAIGAQGGSGGGYHNGRVDEFRIASVVRSSGWMATERNNQASSTSFYAVSAEELKFLRAFTDTNVSILGSYVSELGGNSTLPTGVLSIGGSFSNDADFNANGGTVRFNSAAGAETISAGNSAFATLEFNSATGDFTVIENATATVAIGLTNAAQFTLASGTVLATQGTFTHAVSGANTTWTGSILRLLRGSELTLNAKSHGGDIYGTLEAASSTLVKMWNSSASSYLTTGVTDAIYSQDHATIDGDLYIFGNYARTTGTEYWSYATDFDGAALVASTSRQVDVRIATSSAIGFVNSTLNLVGTAIASTTIAAQAGTFSLNATNTNITAEHFRVSGTGVGGFGLLASTTLSLFRDAFFTVAPSFSGVTIAVSTVDTNPAAQFYRVGFATSSPGTAFNVTLSGTPSSFVWFREGSGGLYGEAYDSGDTNPGAIRFDDSSNTIVVSGTVYADDGVTTLAGPTCDGVTQNVRIVVDGGAYASSTSCSAATGAYSFAAVAYIGDPKVVVYLDTNGGVAGSVVTKTPTGNITNMHIYANRVITRHQDILPLSASDMQSYDYDNDTDIKFTAATSSLMVLPNTELYVFASTTFTPGGNITLQGNGNSNGYEGTLQLGAGASFTATGTETHTLAGRFVMATTSTFTAASSTFIFNATTTGKSITAANIITFNQLEFSGNGGGWNISAPLNILANMYVATGTVTGTSNITLANGSLFGNGVLSFGSGTTTINRSNTLGGTSAWTFNNLVLGSGSNVGTTTPNTTATTTILGKLTIANAHFLAAGNSVWDLAGTGTVLQETGTILEGTSTIRFSGANSFVPATTYYNLITNAGVGSATYTGSGLGILVLNDLIVGGTASSTLDLNTADQTLEVRGDVVVAPTGTLLASNSAVLTVLSDWTNTGSFAGNNGTVRFTGTGTSNIAAGNSSFANLEIDGTGNYTITENATTSGNFSLINHNNSTLASGKTLAIGSNFLNNIAGANTTWTGSNLVLFGSGVYEINDSATGDTYETLVISAGTQVELWNSTATTYAINSTGSLYSQDHASVDGDLYIFGQMIRTTGDDYWNNTIDFDGTDLTGSERAANVYFASGASGSWSGSATLSVIGAVGATSTIQNQGSGVYSFTIGSGAVTEWQRVQIRDTNIDGIVFTGTPTVNDFSYTDHLVASNNASAITVAGTVINANEAKNFTNNVFAETGGLTSPKNVTASGTSVSSWRFTNHTGNLAGEAYDSDPAGDPGYLVWDNSAALITVSGNVYSDEGSTVSTVCDGVTANIRLVVAGLTTYDTTCNAGTGAFSISGVAFSPLDTLSLYINGETAQAANISTAPISSIGNMHLYENRVIVRHENTDPQTIAKMAVWDSSDDADIPFTAVDAGSDTLTLPTDTKLLIWSGKTFEPNGNVTVSGGGGGAAFDGTLEAQNNARFRAKTTETHSIGGSVIFGTGAEFVSASSTLILTTSGSGRTFDVNANSLHNLTVSGAGSWNITDATLTVAGSYSQAAGVVTFPTGTTTIGAAFNVTGGSFVSNTSNFNFISSTAGNTVRFNNSQVNSLFYTGSGGWNMTDVNATSTGAVLITAGSVSLPSGSLALGGSFRKIAGTLTHNTCDLIMYATSSAQLTASTSDLFAARFTGTGPFTMTDSSITLLDSLEIASGTVTLASTTTAVGGSFTATGGSFVTASGTVLLNAAVAGKVINPGVSNFYNLQIAAPAGGYTIYSATTTNNFTIANVSSLTIDPTAIIVVKGVFTNSVGGAATTWTGSSLVLDGQNTYSINSRINSGDTYGSLRVGANSDIKIWYSNASAVSVDSTSSFYSQDNANTNGSLYIYGDLNIATTTEYWSYATDFDGTALSGSERAVAVRLAQNATTTVQSGSLQIVGATGNETTIANQATGTYAIAALGGTINANYFSFANLDLFGLRLQNLTTVTNLSNGLFALSYNTGSLITLSSTTLNANPSKTFDNVGFTATSGLSGFNVTLDGETTNAWRFTNNYGNIGGEGFDVDGIDACGSVRFDDSSCLLTEQTHVRWRNDDGAEGVPDTEWYDASFNNRTRVRVLNNDNQAYASTAVKVAIAYDAAMQSDFEDIRFTSADGLTEIPFWIEKYTASTDAQLWVSVPVLPASAHATLFMYYGSSTATSLSSGAQTFNAFDDFEDNNITEYSGDTSLFSVSATPVFGGSYALKPSSTSGKTTDGIFRFDKTVVQGEIIRYMQYVNTAGSTDEPCTLFAVQSPGTTNSNYAVCLELFGVDRLSLAKDVDNNDSSGTILATSTVSYTTGWYEVEIDWRTNNSINVSLFNAAGTLVASAAAADATYTSGGYGFAFWFQNGAWDSFTSRARVTTRPTVYLGAKQSASGASWLATLDSSATAIPNDIVRLRLAVENSGLDITSQLYRLEFASKGAAPTCESVGSGSYSAVPNQASCGSSPVCMQTSTFVTNAEVTTDLLFDTNGTFSSGQLVTSPSNETTALAIDQNYYTELEYVLSPTVNAGDSYCFRVTNAGTELDFYAKVAELSLQFDPLISSASLNAGLDISLTPGTTTAVLIAATTTDLNGYSDIEHATATIYRSGSGAGCSANNNDCYVLTTENGGCTFNNCSDNSCLLSCQANVAFHADPTDFGDYEGQEWLAYTEVEDASGGYDFDSAPGVELVTLRALEVDSLINYGALSVDSDTGSFNPTTTIVNLGNTPIDVDVEGTDLTDGGVSYIPADRQKVSTSTFAYGACVSCFQLSSSSAVTLDINLLKPSVNTPPVETDVYWGIQVPLGINSAPHSGTNIFTAIGI